MGKKFKNRNEAFARIQSGPFTPLLLATFVFAAGEEIGWRGFALPRLLKRGISPLKAAFLFGVPWALFHLPLTLPGKLAEGVPPLAQFLVLLSLSVITRSCTACSTGYLG